jgi:uncharacterized damage-inducible protein DinB
MLNESTASVVPARDAGQAFVSQARTFLISDYLPKIERCVERLTDDQVWWRANAESNSIGNLLLHLCGNARQWIVSGLGGELDQRTRQREFNERAIISREELLARLRTTLGEVDDVLAGFKTAQLLDAFHIQGSDVTALEAIFHVVEHFSMHTGQIILLTKALAKTDLGFYSFANGAPVHTWRKPSVVD